MDFGQALAELKAANLVARAGWNDKGMYLGLCTDWNGNCEVAPVARAGFRMLPFIYMSTAQGDIVPWLASQTDILADDWQIAIAQG